MKKFTIAVVVAIVLAFICIQESFAVPLTEVQELEEPTNNDNPPAEHPDITLDSWMTPYNNRQKRAFKCKVCCGCCQPGVCGLCCKF